MIDNSSLEKGDRRRLVEALRAVLMVEAEHGTKVTVVTTDPSFKIVHLLRSPGLDLYQVLYSTFDLWADQLDLEIPTLWASQHNLVPQFETLAVVAQVTGTTAHVEAEAAGSQPFEDTDKVVQTVRLVIPVDGLGMAAEESNRVATLAVAVVAVDASGEASDPKLFLLPVAVPADRVAPGARAASSFRLVLEPGTQALAVALQDEASGQLGSFSPLRERWLASPRSSSPR